MARQSKVLKHGLADLVLELRRKGQSSAQIAKACGERAGEPFTSKSIDRHLATVDRASAVEAHVPETAAENARLAVDVAERLNLLDTTIGKWLADVEDAERVTVVGSGQDAYEVRTPDWAARTAVSRELRETAKTVVDLLERVHNAEQIELFQQSVVAAIRAADPDVARKVLEAMRDHHSIRRAALLGA